MPLRVSDLINKRKETALEWEGETIRLTFRYYSTEIGGQIDSDEPNHDWIVGQLKALLLDWNLEGDDGQRAPIDDDVLNRLPRQCVVAMNRAIVAALRPNPPSAETTAAG